MFKSWNRVFILAVASLREMLLFNRWFQLFLVGLICLILGLQSLSQLPLGSSSAKLMFDLGQGGILVSLGIVLVITVAHQLFNDLNTGVIPVYLVRSVRRWEYLAGKAIGVWLAIVFTGGLAVWVLSLLVRYHLQGLITQGLDVAAPDGFVWLQLWCFHGCQWLMLASVVVFFSLLSRTFLFPVVSGLLVWLGSIVALGMISFAETTGGATGRLWALLSLILPRFDLSHLPGRLWYEGGYDPAGWFVLVWACLLYSGLLFLVSAFMFGRRGV